MNINNPSPPVQATHGATPQPNEGGVTVNFSKSDKYLRLPAVEDLTALRKSTLYALMAEGKFPTSVRLAARAVAWRESEVLAWCDGRIKAGGQ